MVELSNERVEKILHEETKKTEALPLVLRSIYTRYMYLYENYFADFEALNEEKIAELRKYHEETKSLINYYYMDIPQDICTAIKTFEENGSSHLLGPEWKKNLYDMYDEFKEKNTEWDESEPHYKAEFKKEALKEFYEAMEYVFRDGFGTNSKSADDVLDGLSGLLFGKKEK